MYIEPGNVLQDELAGKGGQTFLELAVVQDADRLDAIGAVGIARCFTFGGKFNRVLHDPSVALRSNLTAAEYKSGEATTLNHFYEKLLKLKACFFLCDCIRWPLAHICNRLLQTMSFQKKLSLYPSRGLGLTHCHPYCVQEQYGFSCMDGRVSILILQEMMKTQAGRQIAESRHAFLEAFLDQFHREWRAEA